MKSWLLYFLSVAAVLCLLPAARMLPAAEDKPLTVTVLDGDGVLSDVEIEEYITRVLCAEGGRVPDTEAAKALAVTLRTAACYVRTHGCKHDDFDFCSSPDCCFPLILPEECGADTLAAARSAADATRGETLTLDGKAVMALYTACGGAGTRDCAEYPYIVGVPRRTVCETHIGKVSFATSELARIFGVGSEVDELCLIREPSGYCRFAVLNGELFDAYSLKSALELPSQSFTGEDAGGAVTFTCRGLGNGYGLDLCYASELAASGADYREILNMMFPALSIAAA